MNTLTSRHKILVLAGLVVLLRPYDLSTDCLAHPNVLGCALRYLLPVLVFLATLVFLAVNYCRSLCKESCSRRQPSSSAAWLPVLLLVSTTTLYLWGWRFFSGQQSFMDTLYFSYYRGDNVSWFGEKQYKIHYKHLERNQSEVLGVLQGREIERVERNAEAINQRLESYTGIMDRQLEHQGIEGHSEPSVGMVLRQSYLQQEPYNLYHLGVYNLTKQLLKDVQETSEVGWIFDPQKLEYYHIYRRKQEGRFNAWLEDRYMYANLALVLWRDGGWILYATLLLAVAALFIADCKAGASDHTTSRGRLWGWLKNMLLLNTLSYLLVVFVLGFLFCCVSTAFLKELYRY